MIGNNVTQWEKIPKPKWKGFPMKKAVTVELASNMASFAPSKSLMVIERIYKKNVAANKLYRTKLPVHTDLYSLVCCLSKLFFYLYFLFI